jgi:hypothetical protein
MIADLTTHHDTLRFSHNLVHEDHDMLRTFITSTNTVTNPSGPGVTLIEYKQVNGILYDNYAFADPLVGSLAATKTPLPLMQRAQNFIDANFYRIFYPNATDLAIVRNNTWLAYPPCIVQ